MSSARLIIDPPAAGLWNMAVDEALLRSASELGLATLRLYQWNEPTLSLGYFQAAEGRRQHAASLSCPLVRRASGGGAIVHDRELTYSLAVPISDVRSAHATQLYDAVHASLIECLATFQVPAAQYSTADACRSPAAGSPAEPFLCFQRRACGDLISGGAKIVGSAQRRRRGAVLQHGSILLACSNKAPELPGIRELTGQLLDVGELGHSLVERLEAKLPLHFQQGALAPNEQLLIHSILATFADNTYIYRR